LTFLGINRLHWLGHLHLTNVNRFSIREGRQTILQGRFVGHTKGPKDKTRRAPHDTCDVGQLLRLGATNGYMRTQKEKQRKGNETI
jgi:hypothetical protein